MPLRIASAVFPAEIAAFPSGRAAAVAATASPSDVVDVTFEPTGSGTATAWAASPADQAAAVAVALDSERRAEFGGVGHRHGPGACGFCRRAAAAYR